MSNLLTDLHATMIPFPGHPHVLVHKGFLKAYMRVRFAIFETISKHMKQHCKFYCVGHSMGGALATLCIWDIYKNLMPRGVL